MTAQKIVQSASRDFIIIEKALRRLIEKNNDAKSGLENYSEEEYEYAKSVLDDIYQEVISLHKEANYVGSRNGVQSVLVQLDDGSVATQGLISR